MTPSRAGGRRWLGAYSAALEEALARRLEEYERSAAQLARHQLQEDLWIRRQSHVIGMTTTGEKATAPGLGLGPVTAVVPVLAPVLVLVQFLAPVLALLPVPVLVPTLEPVTVPALAGLPVLVVLELVPAPKGAAGGG